MPNYSAEDAHAVFERPVDEVHKDIARWAQERRPAIRGAIERLTGRPASDTPAEDGRDHSSAT